MPFVFQIFDNPVIALLPTMVILIAYASRTKMPFGLPGGLFALLIGVALAWGLRLAGLELFAPSGEKAVVKFYFPSLYLGDLFAFLSDPRGWKYMGIIVPMGLFNIIGSLQNLESAEAAGDRYETRPSLLANGIGSIAAAACGSAFPTTIYIGHPGWKALGARAAYSTINGVVIVALTLFGGIALIEQYVPMGAVIGILLWVGMIIMAQSFQDVPKKHAPAVALGLTPSLAAWALVLMRRRCGRRNVAFQRGELFGQCRKCFHTRRDSVESRLHRDLHDPVGGAGVCHQSAVFESGGMDGGGRHPLHDRRHPRLRADRRRRRQLVWMEGGA